MENNIEKILLTEEQIQAKVNEFAAMLSEEYAGKDPIFVGVLKGVVMFFGDVVKRVTIPCQIDFMWVSSYEGTTSTYMQVAMWSSWRIFLIQAIPWNLLITIC